MHRLIIATPCVALALLSGWWTVGLTTRRGLWPSDDVTLSEAVATRNNAEALRLIAQGADPNQPGPVREGLLTNGYDVVMLPVEAAVAAQRADSLRMLLANGAFIDGQELQVLRCLERARHDAGVRDILDARASSEPDCGDVRLPTDRTR
jgi:hypothetical protein